jgi:hypothetical protein
MAEVNGGVDYTPKNILVTGGAGESDGSGSYRLGIGRRDR